MKAKMTLLVEYDQFGDLTDEQGLQIVSKLILSLGCYGDLTDTHEIYIRSLEIESYAPAD